MEPTFKKRTENFNQGEEQILISLVKQYKHIVESKKTDAVTNSEKLKAWEIIGNEYNTICSGFKTAQTLRTKFNNLKKTKQKFAIEKRLARSTGGGPPTPEIRVNEVDVELRSMMRHTLTGFKSRFDGDPIQSRLIEGAETETPHDESSEEQIVIQYIHEDLAAEHEVNYDPQKDYSENMFQHFSRSVAPQNALSRSVPVCSETNDLNKLTAPSSIIDEDDKTLITNDWSSYTPAKQKQHKSAELKVLKSESTSTIKDHISTWALSKSDLVKSQKRAFEEEHQLKLRHMTEKHEQSLEIQREDWELRRRHMIEIHNQQLANLKSKTDN